MVEDIGGMPNPVTDEMMAFAKELGEHIGDQINKFMDKRGLNKKETPLQETLIALGSLVSHSIMQQPEASRPRWVQYLISGVTAGTGVSFLVAYLPPEMETKINENPNKEKMN